MFFLIYIYYFSLVKDMKTVYRGEIINLNIDTAFDFIKICDKTILTKNYRVPLEYRISKYYDNCIEYSPLNDSKLVINYVKRVQCLDNVGILRFREFDGPFYEEKLVHYEVYNLKYPFEITEYCDGNSIIFKINKVKIKYKIICDGLINKLHDNLYRLINATKVVITSESPKNIHYVHTISCLFKYKFNLTHNQLIIFRNVLIEKYLKLEDNKKKEVINMYNESIQGLAIYDITKTGLTNNFLDKKIYIFDNFIIYNFTEQENFKIIVDNKYIFEHQENEIQFDRFRLLVDNKFLHPENENS